MRIVGGKFRGRSISAPDGSDTRPTTDRVREAIFNRLEHGVPGFSIDGTRVLDLFAGTGALGLEALSRGAKHAHFIDNADTARGLIRRNADTLGVIGQCKLWRRDAASLGSCTPMSPYSLVFLDPPYDKGLAERALTSLT
ncbi:MAG: 16S rRNA (guanine(966)-N(2))-methyltransferase RsmD, partial [Anderseniella sp.]